MGNLCGSNRVIPTNHVWEADEDIVKMTRGQNRQCSSSNTMVRMKVVMSVAKLKELMARSAELGRDDSELGRLILRECVEGNLPAHVVVVDAAGGHGLGSLGYARTTWGLSTIKEE